MLKALQSAWKLGVTRSRRGKREVQVTHWPAGGLTGQSAANASKSVMHVVFLFKCRIWIVLSLLGETKKSERSAFRELVMCESAYYWQCITLFVSHAHSFGTHSSTALHTVVWRKIYKVHRKKVHKAKHLSESSKGPFTPRWVYLSLPLFRAHIYWHSTFLKHSPWWAVKKQ